MSPFSELLYLVLISPVNGGPGAGMCGAPPTEGGRGEGEQIQSHALLPALCHLASGLQLPGSDARAFQLPGDEALAWDFASVVATGVSTVGMQIVKLCC